MALSRQPHLSFAGNCPSKPCGSDLLQSSSNGVFGVPLRLPGSVHSGTKKRVFVVSAKLRKVEKHERPWPEDPDPNVRGGVLRHLSFFKPLKVKPKHVTLDFEKPLMDLQKKIIDIQRNPLQDDMWTSETFVWFWKYYDSVKKKDGFFIKIEIGNTIRLPLYSQYNISVLGYDTTLYLCGCVPSCVCK